MINKKLIRENAESILYIIKNYDLTEKWKTEILENAQDIVKELQIPTFRLTKSGEMYREK